MNLLPHGEELVEVKSNTRLKDVLNKDVDALESYLDTLNKAVSASSRRLIERQEELVAHAQAGDSSTYALSFHQFAQNLAVSEQIVNSLDTSIGTLALNKKVITTKINEQSLLSNFAAKAVLTSVAESWEEFKKARLTQLAVRDDIPTLSTTPYLPLVTRLGVLGDKILGFIEEEKDVLDQVFKEIGTLPHLINMLYHKTYTKQIRAAIVNIPSTGPIIRSHSRSNSHSNSLASQPQSSPQQTRAHSHSELDTQPQTVLTWDDWYSLCTEIKLTADNFVKEVAKLCGITSTAEFERYFPLLPVFNDAALSATDLLTDKITKIFNALDVEKEAYNQTKSFPTAHIPHRGSFRNYLLLADSNLLAKRNTNASPDITQSMFHIIRDLDRIVEFISSMEFRPLIDLFMRSILSPIISCSNRFSIAARDVPQTNDIKFLYISINSASVFAERFVMYEHVIAPAYRGPPSNLPPAASPPLSPAIPSLLPPTGSHLRLSQQLRAPDSHETSKSRSLRHSGVNLPSSTIGSLQPSSSLPPTMPSLEILWECQKILQAEEIKQSDQLVSMLVDSCCTHLFPNIDMNDWQDHRAFFADSRPSHGIQMFHFYIQSQYRDLHNHLLAHCVSYVIAHVLRRCGEILLVKYSSISPSRMRSPHYKLDITYLVTTIQTLQSACGVWYTKLCMPSLCAALISLMAIMVAPLDTLCSFLQHNTNLNKKSFLQPPPSSIIHPPALEGIIPNFYTEFWPTPETTFRTEVLPIEDMQFLLEKQEVLSTYAFNYSAILEHCSSEFPRTFLAQLVSNRPELKENVYPPLSDTDKEQLPTLQDFSRPP